MTSAWPLVLVPRTTATVTLPSPPASVVVTVIVVRPRRARTLLGATRTPAIDGSGSTGTSVTSSGSGRTPVVVTAPVSGDPALGFG